MVSSWQLIAHDEANVCIEKEAMLLHRMSSMPDPVGCSICRNLICCELKSTGLVVGSLHALLSAGGLGMAGCHFDWTGAQEWLSGNFRKLQVQDQSSANREVE